MTVKYLTEISKMPENPAIVFPYECDKWQINSFNSIHENNDLLINVPTSSGKTTSAIYAIIYHVKFMKKKVIYTTPIKSLSNEKYNEFTDKFKEYGISVGILTGDNKINPDADIILATAEILRNNLYNFDINIEKNIINITNIGCVIMDEIHYMNDKERGKVWEETIIMLPQKIQLIMLSGTIGNKEHFANWISFCRNTNVDIIFEEKRIIPLKHGIYIGKKIYDYCVNNIFLATQFNEAKKKYIDIKKEREKKHKFHDEKHDIVSITNYLKDNDMLQAIIFSFSKKDCERYANMISDFNFSTQEEKQQIEVLFHHYIEKQKTENGIYKFENIDSVRIIKQMLLRGIAYHHSAILQNIRELIEILMKKKLIKILFATETLCIGVNVPAKTCVFTSIIKPTKFSRRVINSSEYKQMAGRAGRRGLDNIGNVIMLPLREIPSEDDIRDLCSDFSMPIKSNFNFDYQTILKLSQTTDLNPIEIFKRSLSNFEIIQEINKLKLEKNDLELRIKESNSKSFYQKLEIITNKIQLMENYVPDAYQKYKRVLEKMNYINKTNTTYIEKNDILIDGIICSQISDCNSIFLTEIIKNNLLLDLDHSELVALLSIFVEPIQKDKMCGTHEFEGTERLHNIIDKIVVISNDIYLTEKKFIGTDSSSEANISEQVICTDYIDMAYDWGSGKSVYDMTAYFSEYEVPEEMFCKAMIKIGNIIQYIISIYKMIRKNIEIIPILELCHKNIIRDIVSTTSLYLQI